MTLSAVGRGARGLQEVGGETQGFGAGSLGGVLPACWGCVVLDKWLVWLSLSFPTCGMGMTVPGLQGGLGERPCQAAHQGVQHRAGAGRPRLG